MLPRKSTRPKAIVWLVLIILAGFLAFLAERELTLIAGPPFSGYVKVFLICFAAILFLLLCGWAIFWLILQRLQPKPPKTTRNI
jgi:hypothetical protein